MNETPQIPELLLIDKPKGLTSFDVIRVLRKRFNVRKMGHAGTLDPLATGLLLVGIGSGTKKLDALIGLPKVYVAEVLLGTKTTTGDLEGEVLEKQAVSVYSDMTVISGEPADMPNPDHLTLAAIERVLQSMKGKVKLAVPAFSAIKVGGQPLYKMARRGTNLVQPPVRDMEIFWIKLQGHYKIPDDGYVLKLELEVKSGTYIRSIAEEIGNRLKVPATIKELRRTKIGEYRIEDAEKLV